MNAATVMLAVIGRGRGVIRLEAPDGARLSDVLKLRVHLLGERAARITAIGHGIATCSTYAIAPWDLGDLISFVELLALEPATTRPVINATVHTSAHVVGGVTLMLSAGDHAALGSPHDGHDLVLRRADGLEMQHRIGRVTPHHDNARIPNVDRVELDIGKVDGLGSRAVVEIVDVIEPPKPPTRVQQLLRGELHG